jgi:hypothetical protein
VEEDDVYNPSFSEDWERTRNKEWKEEEMEEEKRRHKEGGGDGGGGGTTMEGG